MSANLTWAEFKALMDWYGLRNDDHFVKLDIDPRHIGLLPGDPLPELRITDFRLDPNGHCVRRLVNPPTAGEPMKEFNVRQAANGFIIEPVASFARQGASADSMHVFNDWPAASKWLGDQFRQTDPFGEPSK